MSIPPRLIPTMLVGIATLAGILTVLYAWRLPPFRSSTESTENAYVRGNVTLIAPKVDGYVAEVAVSDYGEVKTGQLLVRLDDRIALQRVAQARAQLAAQQAGLANALQARRLREAQIEQAQAGIEGALAQQGNAAAQLERGRADQRRAELLVNDGAISRRDHDVALAELRRAEAGHRQAQAAVLQSRAAQAAVQQDLRSVVVNRGALDAAVHVARAAVQLAEIDLENTRIRAPRDGRLGEVGVKHGQYVTPGTHLMALVPPQVWVVANFKESQTSLIRPGQRVQMRVDGLAGASLRGRVDSLAPATGAEFSVLRPDNATGNFTKVVQRLPVRIRIEDNQPLAQRLRPGMSVVVDIDTAQDPAGLQAIGAGEHRAPRGTSE